MVHPEPWRLSTDCGGTDYSGSEFVIKDAKGGVVTDDGSSGGEYRQTLDRATAEYIVACVNFIWGMGYKG